MRRFRVGQFALLSIFLLPPILRAEGAVIDDAGVPVKLIATRATSLHADPDRSSASSPVNLFTYWYVLPPDSNMPSRRKSDLGTLTRNGFYRVASGVSESDVKGWIAEDDVVVWGHRQALQPADRQGRSLVTFYASSQEAVSAVSTGNLSLATHREPVTSNGLLLMPILDVEDVEIDGESNRLFRVAFVSEGNGSGGGSPAGGAGGLTRPILRAKTTVDIVFVVDTTASMQRPIDQVRLSIARVAQELSGRPELRRRLRLGLVGYRDTADGFSPGQLEYVTKVICNLKDGANHDLFQKRLAAMEIAQYPSDDYPEEVLAGLATALDEELMDWNPLAWKQIVVVGDSSAKSPDHPDKRSRRNFGGYTVQRIIDLADGGAGSNTKTSWVISAVRIKDPLFPDDHVAGDRQFYQLVSGRNYNGMMIEKRGGAYPQLFWQELRNHLIESLEAFEESVLRSGNLPSSLPPPGKTAADYPYPVLDLLRRLPDESTGSEQRFASRYCTELDADGNRVLIPHLFARRGRLNTFSAYLDLVVGILEDSGDPASRDVTAIIEHLQSISASLQIDESVTTETVVEDVLSGILDLPIKTPIFRMTFGELAAMSQSDFQEWIRSVDAVQEMMKSVIENENLWFKLHPNAQDRDAHAFIALSDLP